MGICKATLGSVFLLAAVSARAGGAFTGFEKPADLPGAVSMVWTGKEVLTEVSGYADLATKRPVSTNDLFWIASNTKAIACALMLLQVDKGLVKLDAPVGDYLSEWKDIRIKDGKKPSHAPTVRELMGHTAGLAFFPRMPITQFSVEELAHMAVTNGLDHDVGIYSYSNWGIDVAMAVVERVTGRPWELSLKDEVLDPLGMKDTTFFPTVKDCETRMAKSYRFDPHDPGKPPVEMTVGQLVFPYDKPGTHAEAGGGLFATASDLLAFFRMVANRGKLPDGRIFISEKLMEEWYGLTDFYQDRKYTFGLEADAKRGFVRHGGAYDTDGAANWKRGTARVFMTQIDGWTARSVARRRNWEDYAARWLDFKAIPYQDVFGREVPYLAAAKPVWAKGREREQNLSLRFEAPVKLAGKEKRVVVRATGCSVYRIRINGAFAGYGPARGPKGYDRVDEWDVTRFVRAGKNGVEIDVAGYNVPNYYLPDQPSYLQAEVVADGKVVAATGDGLFGARALNRERKVPRYSFQRPFGEVWNVSNPLVGEPLELVMQPVKPLLPRRAAYPDFAVNDRARQLSEGRARYDAKAPVRNYWPLDVTGPTKDARGFPQEECTIIPSREAERYVDDSQGKVKTSVWDFGLLDCGFVGVQAKARGKGRVLVVFDEVLTDGKVDFLRGGTANVVIWNFDKPGDVALESFEPYAFRYAKFIVDGDIELSKPYIRTYKSPSADAFACPTEDPELKKIFEAARETFRQNAVDVFTDCPGRERAGWLCDSFFTARVSHLLTGSLALEELFLENYLLADCPDIPKAMFPMCYPADHVNRNFIPNWAMWLVLELEEYRGRGGDPALIAGFERKVTALVDYLQTFENADGLLESLPAWVFVEWSECNDLTKGVNYPSNMTWARALEAVATLYGRDDLRAKAAKVRETIVRQSFDGTWFHDQALRGKNGELVRGPQHTETCQYYAFYFGTASFASHPQLWKTLVGDFGPGRKIRNKHPDVPFSNAFIGNYLRLELLQQSGLDKTVEADVRGYFLPMAEKTGTLWEHDLPSASCCHGFASHVAVVLDRPKRRFEHVFSWGTVKDEASARAYAEIGVTDVRVRGEEGFAAAKRHGLRAYCGFGPRGPHPQVVRPEERLVPAKSQFGGEPIVTHDRCPETVVCFLSDTDCVLSKAALAKRLLDNPRADGIAFDYIGYTNLHSCECEDCKARLASWLKERGLDVTKENRNRFFRESLVAYINTLSDHAKKIRPGIRVAMHLYPAFAPDPLYGKDIRADFIHETVAWYFLWPEEKIADYTRRIVTSPHRPGAVSVPFVGLNGSKGGALAYKSPERIEAELKLILENGGRSLSVCNGEDMLKPGYREVFKKFSGLLIK